ncbi:MAG TPA: methyltransferase domain-containing protein [Ktedonobacterales bacterium]|nr:methyltransferase domain-containing protein [Ktedonobacterales bacterium]
MGNDATRDQEQWQLDGSAPEVYQRYLVPTVTALWAADLVDRAALQPGERVLDVACGTGVVARSAAARVGHAGRVAALDLNPGMLVVARSLPAMTGVVIEWHEGSALALPFPQAAFDVALCQLGLQFFPDRPMALQEIRRVLVPDGRLALNVFGPPEHNPATHVLTTALDRHVGPAASVAKRTEHALADIEQLHRLITDAGFRDIVIRTTSKLVHFPSPADYVRIQLAATPLASLIAQDDAEGRECLVAALVEDVGAALLPYVGDAGLIFPQEVHSVLATS